MHARSPLSIMRPRTVGQGPRGWGVALDMQETNRTNLFDFADWSSESLRLSIFHLEAAVTGLWEKVVDAGPESTDARPQQGIHREQGRVRGNQLLFVTQPQRIDWNLLPDPSMARQAEDLPSLVDVGQAMPLLQRALRVSLNPLRRVNRLAFGAVLVQSAPDLAEGWNQLAKELPDMGLETRPAGRDFIYQINRQRRSPSASHVTINRIARWTLEQFVTSAIRISPSQAPQMEASGISYISKLTLDINTAPDNNAISKDAMLSLFDDLTIFAREIAHKGDVP